MNPQGWMVSRVSDTPRSFVMPGRNEATVGSSSETEYRRVAAGSQQKETMNFRSSAGRDSVIVWSSEDEALCRDYAKSPISDRAPPATPADPLCETGARGVLLKSDHPDNNGDMETRVLSHRLNKICRRLSVKELVMATNGFESKVKLGEGANGHVFGGHLPCGTPVAIKCLQEPAGGGSSGFEHEVNILSRYRHPYIVLLLGFAALCTPPLETMPQEDIQQIKNAVGISDEVSNRQLRLRFLVYEFLSGGDLSSLLITAPQNFHWTQRVKAAHEAAVSLAFLHSCRPPVYHRDVKTANIILSATKEAKLADFGLAASAYGNSTGRGVRVQKAEGTPGYADPKYIQTLEVTEDTEVYSFGMVLLELLTCRPPAVYAGNTRGSQTPKLCYLLEDLNPDDPTSALPLVDKTAQFQSETSEIIARIAYSCISETSPRPSMATVATQLGRILETSSVRWGIKCDRNTQTNPFSYDDDRPNPSYSDLALKHRQSPALHAAWNVSAPDPPASGAERLRGAASSDSWGGTKPRNSDPPAKVESESWEVTDPALQGIAGRKPREITQSQSWEMGDLNRPAGGKFRISEPQGTMDAGGHRLSATESRGSERMVKVDVDVDPIERTSAEPLPSVPRRISLSLSSSTVKDHQIPIGSHIFEAWHRFGINSDVTSRPMISERRRSVTVEGPTLSLRRSKSPSSSLSSSLSSPPPLPHLDVEVANSLTRATAKEEEETTGPCLLKGAPAGLMVFQLHLCGPLLQPPPSPVSSGSTGVEGPKLHEVWPALKVAAQAAMSLSGATSSAEATKMMLVSNFGRLWPQQPVLVDLESTTAILVCRNSYGRETPDLVMQCRYVLANEWFSCISRRHMEVDVLLVPVATGSSSRFTGSWGLRLLLTCLSSNGSSVAGHKLVAGEAITLQHEDALGILHQTLPSGVVGAILLGATVVVPTEAAALITAVFSPHIHCEFAKERRTKTEDPLLSPLSINSARNSSNTLSGLSAGHDRQFMGGNPLADSLFQRSDSPRIAERLVTSGSSQPRTASEASPQRTEGVSAGERAARRVAQPPLTPEKPCFRSANRLSEGVVQAIGGTTSIQYRTTTPNIVRRDTPESPLRCIPTNGTHRRIMAPNLSAISGGHWSFPGILRENDTNQ